MINPKIKQLGEKSMTGFMLLGLTLDYIESINNQEPVIVLNSLDRVVSIESDRFIEMLFE